MSRLPISVIILTYNEEVNIGDCLRSVIDWAGEVFVVDSGSTDGTLSIAAEYNVQIAAHPFETHARQWIWALHNIDLRYEWVLGLDADQRVTPELREELRQLFSTYHDTLSNIDGLYVKRRQIFRGSWIRHGGYYPKYLLKFFRHHQVIIDEQDLMDHHFYVSGKTAQLQHDILEDNRKEQSIAFWTEKHNRYAVLHAKEELKRRCSQHTWPLRAALFGTPDQQVIWLKQRWDHLPLYVRPFIYFFLRYFILLGFLDGKQGFIFHFLQGFWYRLLVDIHLDDALQQSRTSN